MSKKQVKIIKLESLYAGYFRVNCYHLQHELFAGGMSDIIDREVFQRGHAAAVLLFDPSLNSVVLIEQFRVGSMLGNQPWLLETVAGMIEADENLETVARREAEEEAGCTIKKLIPIYKYWSSPGGSDETVSLFLGIVDASQIGGLHGLASEGEDIKVHVMPAEEAFALLKKGDIKNATTIIALQWLELNLQNFLEGTMVAS